MGIIDRIILALYTFILTFLSLAVTLVAVKLVSLEWAQRSIELIYGRWDAAVIGGVFFIISLRLLYFGLVRRDRSNQKAIVQQTTLGELRVTYTALENLVHKAVYQVPGVKDLRTSIRALAEGISVTCKIMVAPDVVIPELSEQIQARVRDYLAEIVGITVKETKVLVENINGDGSVRVK